MKMKPFCLLMWEILLLSRNESIPKNTNYEKNPTNGEDALHLTKIYALLDVRNITHMDLFGSEEYNKLRDIEKFNLYAGLCLMTNSNSKYRFLFFNRQDYKRFIYTLEATYSIKIPFWLDTTLLDISILSIKRVC